MADKLGETPEGIHGPDREKIRLILQKANEVVVRDKNKGPSEIMKKLAGIIDNPSMNEVARLLSLLLAIKAPETLLENKHLIMEQTWATKVLARAISNVKDKSG